MLGAYLLEQKQENLFEVSVGNLPPEKEVLISITYITELFFEENKVSNSSREFYFILCHLI
jgi:hypothetical protein